MDSLKMILTPRQFEVAGLVAKGLRNKDVANLLNIKVSTMRVFLKKSFDRAGCETRTALAVRYVLEEERGLYKT